MAVSCYNCDKLEVKSQFAGCVTLGNLFTLFELYGSKEQVEGNNIFVEF